MPAPRAPSIAASEKKLQETLAEFGKAGKGDQGANSRATPHTATADWEKAHFQVGAGGPARSPLRARDLEKDEWAFCLARALNMGDPHSAPSWRGVAEFMMEVTEECLVAPCSAHTDDSTLLSAGEDVEDCAKNFDVAPAALGLVRPPEEESDQVSRRAKRVKILGVCPERPEEGLAPPASPEKAGAVLRLSESAAEGAPEKSLDYKCAAEPLGDVDYASRAGSDRAGAQILRPVFPMQRGDLSG